jgi:hypothetical protein
MDSRGQREGEHRGKTGPHPHRRGCPVDAPLPKLKRKNEKIQRYAINKFWLENDKPTRIVDWKDDNESSGERQYSSEQSDNKGDQFDDELYL